MVRVVALVLTLAGALLWAIVAALPPAPKGIDAPAHSFSAARAMADVAAVGSFPHPTGSVADNRVIAHLTVRLRALGAEVSEQRTPLGRDSLARLSKWSGRAETNVAARNLIGIFPGRNRALPPILLMAHHDSVWGSPGAADDAMGVAVALEVARAVTARHKPERDLVLLFTDSEELGLDGAKAFFDHHPLAGRIGAIVNMEARGAGGRANMFETGPGNGAMMRLYAERVARPATNSLSIFIYNNMPNYTDYTVAKAMGIPGFNLAVLDRGWAYHSPAAMPAVVDRGSLQDMGNQALALTVAMVFAEALPPRAGDASFADLMGRATIVYPAAAGWLILLVAVCLIGFALSRNRPPLRRIGEGGIATVALLLHGALLVTAYNAVSGSGGGNYYDRLAALPLLESLAALLVVATLLLIPVLRRPEMRLLAIAPAMALMWAGLLTGGPVALVILALLAMLAAWYLPVEKTDLGTSATLLLVLIGIVVQALAPTAAPLVHWPLLLAAIAAAARAWLGERAALPTTALCGAIGIGHLLAQAHFIFLGVGAEMPAVLLILLFAALPLLLPLWPDKLPWRIAGVPLAIALVLALWIRLDPIAPSIPVYSNAEGGKKTRD